MQDPISCWLSSYQSQCEHGFMCTEFRTLEALKVFLKVGLSRAGFVITRVQKVCFTLLSRRVWTN